MQEFPFFFDYIFYSVTKAFYKRDDKFGVTGILAVTFIQGFTVLSLIVLMIPILATQGNREMLGRIGYIAAVVTFVGLTFANVRKYAESYIKFKKHWIKESKREAELRGYLVFLVVIAPIVLFLVLIGTVKVL